MMVYDPLWKTLKEKGITKYYLKTYCGVNNNTIHKLIHNKPINTITLEKLCEILDCRVEDVIQYIDEKSDFNKVD